MNAPGPSQSDDPLFCGLWSLWDMLERYALKYIELGAAIEKVKQAFAAAFDAGDHALNAAERQELRELLAELAVLAADLDLEVAAQTVRHAQFDMPATLQALNQLIYVVFAEGKSRTLLVMPSERRRYYEWDEVVSDAVKTAFPESAAEIRSAATCYALDQHTSAVFHAMRAAEIGTRKLAAELKVTLRRALEYEDWQRLITEIGIAVKAIGEGGALTARPRARSRSDFLFAGSRAASIPQGRLARAALSWARDLQRASSQRGY